MFNPFRVGLSGCLCLLFNLNPFRVWNSLTDLYMSASKTDVDLTEELQKNFEKRTRVNRHHECKKFK